MTARAIYGQQLFCTRFAFVPDDTTSFRRALQLDQGQFDQGLELDAANYIDNLTRDIPADIRVPTDTAQHLVATTFELSKKVGKRFNCGEFGAWYCALQPITSVKEIVYHQGISKNSQNHPKENASMLVTPNFVGLN